MKERLSIAALALAAALLAYLSPVSTENSDSAIALLVSQALLDHQTFDLSAYRGAPGCAYDFDRDYRIRRRGDGYFYYAFGVPLLSLPAVWLANRAGYHMLDQAAELELQNLLSALVCAAVVWLVYALGRRQGLAASAALLVTTVVVFGSSLISTLATGLWNLGYASIFLLLALLTLTGNEGGNDGPPETRRLLAALGFVFVAFVVRPAALFMGVGIACVAAATWLPRLRRWRHWRHWRRGTVAVVIAAGSAAALFLIVDDRFLPSYYSPRRLHPQTPLAVGIYGQLLSPSRGLLVFSPFLWAVLAGCVWHWRRLRAQPLSWLVAGWSLSHLLVVSIKGGWWGGHSFGPRLTAEIVIAAILPVVWLWRWSAPRGLFRRAFVVLGVLSLAIHSGQGLFQPAAQRWNREPNVDIHHRLLFWWRYPQLLASDRQIDQRAVELAREHLEPYRPGDIIAPESRQAIFAGWYPAKSSWRWSRGPSAEILFRLAEVDHTSTYVLELRCGALGAQQLDIALNGRTLDRRFPSGFTPQAHRLVVPGSVLVGDGDNVLRLDLPGARPANDIDPRVLGVVFHSLRLLPLAVVETLDFAADAYFLSGFSSAEAGWRWTDGQRARLIYPLLTVDSDRLYQLVLEGWSYGEQRFTIEVGYQRVAEGSFAGQAPQIFRAEVPSNLLRAGANDIVFRLPGARQPVGDPRRIALAFVSLRIEALEASTE